MEKLSHFFVMHWDLILLLVSVLTAIVINEFLDAKKRGKELSPQEAVAMMNADKTLVVDLRDSDNFRQGHIIHSIQATETDFEQGKMDKHKTKPLLLVCSRGLQSKTMAAKLKSKGFTSPMVLSGGITGWKNADLPLVKGK